MKLNLGAWPHPLEGFANLDPGMGWRMEMGLPQPAASVEAITISHMLHAVPLGDWPAAFAELYRVLEPGGVCRITDDDTENPESERHAEPWREAVTLTGPKVVRLHLREAGFRVRLQSATTTGWRDDSLMQAFHGDAPKCFWIEGRKPADG